MPLVIAQAAEGATSSATSEAVLFWVFAVLGIGAALAMISLRNIVHAALMLVINLVAIAALYLALQSSFLGIIQIIVYAGAIMVLFLFVIMLLGVQRDDLLFATRRWHRIGAAVSGLLLAGLVIFALSGDYLTGASRCGGQADPEEVAASTAVPCEGLDTALVETDEGSVGVVAERMFTRYTFPFEASALLLVVATIGALVLGRRGDDTGGLVPDAGPDEPVAPTEDTDELLSDAPRGPEVH